MGQARRRARLALGPRAPRASSCMAMRLTATGALEALVLGQPHDAEAARADLAHQPVAPEHAPRRRRRRPRARGGGLRGLVGGPHRVLASPPRPASSPCTSSCGAANRSGPMGILAFASPTGSSSCRSSTRVTSPHECDAPRAPRRPATAGAAVAPGQPPPDRQTARLRQAVGLGALVVLALLIVLGFKGCLDSRKDNALKDYNRNVDGGRQRLRPVGGQAVLPAHGQRRAQLAGPAGAGQPAARGRRGATSSARKAFDVPGDMKAGAAQPRARAQPARRGLTKIADQIPGRAGPRPDLRGRDQQITGEMQAFLASDVVYAAARGAAHQGGARPQRHQRPADRRQPLPDRRPLAGAGDRRRAARPQRRRRRRQRRRRPRPACTATGWTGSASAPSRCSPSPGVQPRPVGRQPDDHGQVREPGRQRRVQRQGPVSVKPAPGRRSLDEDGRPDQARQSAHRRTSRSAPRRRPAADDASGPDRPRSPARRRPTTTARRYTVIFTN